MRERVAITDRDRLTCLNAQDMRRESASDLVHHDRLGRDRKLPLFQTFFHRDENVLQRPIGIDDDRLVEQRSGMNISAFFFCSEADRTASWRLSIELDHA